MAEAVDSLLAAGAPDCCGGRLPPRDGIGKAEQRVVAAISGNVRLHPDRSGRVFQAQGHGAAAGRIFNLVGVRMRVTVGMPNRQ